MSEENVLSTRGLNRRRLVQLSAISTTSFALAAAAAWSSRGRPVNAQDHTHWSYEGEAGPEYWGELDPEYASCSEGQAQSPIDIADPAESDLTNVEIDYKPLSPMKIVNNGHTIQVTVDPGSTLTVDGVAYELQQFHFHQPSEHTINGEHFALEMHLVNKTPDAGIAVLSVLLQEGDGGEPFAPIFDNLPTEIGVQQTVEATVNIADLLPPQAPTYRYSGSLTTPPCTEGVQWLIFTEPSVISADQVALAGTYRNNARPVQPLNERPVEEDATE